MTQHTLIYTENRWIVRADDADLSVNSGLATPDMSTAGKEATAAAHAWAADRVRTASGLTVVKWKKLGKTKAPDPTWVANTSMTWAFRFPLAPTASQRRQFASHAGAARYAYNWGVAKVAEALDAYAAEKASGVAKPTVTIPGHFELCKSWTAFKDDPGNELGWVGDNFSGSYQAALRDADMAWKRFFASRARQMRGRRVGRPRFKKKGRARDSFQMHGTLTMPDSAHLKLPKVGAVRINGRGYRGPSDLTDPRHRSGRIARRLHNLVASGEGRIVRATIAREGDGQWWVSVTVERDARLPAGPTRRQREGGVIGIDLGVKYSMVTSTGEVHENPALLERALLELRAASRTLSRTQPDSNRRAKARRRVAALHAEVARRRKDHCNKLTTDLVRRHAGIAVEGWDIQQTAQRGSKDLPKRLRRDRNRRLADAAPGLIRWQLEYKSAATATVFVKVDAHAPTGRTCPSCGTVKAKPVPLGQDTFVCLNCGFTLDRRVVAARNARNRSFDGPGPPDPDVGGPPKPRGGGVRPDGPRPGGRPPMKRDTRAGP